MVAWPQCLEPRPQHSEVYRDVYETFIAVDWKLHIGLELPNWPIYLQLLVRQIFASHFPSAILFGDDLKQIYNEAYKRTLGQGVHPDLMGQAWEKAYQDLEQKTKDLEALRGVLKHGDSLSGLAQQHFIKHTNNVLEETFFDYNTAPFWDEQGAIKGLIVTMSDQTGAVITRRRERAIAQLQASNMNVRLETDLFQAIEKVADDYADDFPCLLGYHCQQPLASAGDRTYTRVVASGVNTVVLPDSVSSLEAFSSVFPEGKATLKDYMLDVLRSGREVTLTDPEIISTFCQRRAFGDLTRKVVLTPIYALATKLPAGISIQGLNPRRPRDDGLIVQQFSQCLLSSIEMMHNKKEHEATEEQQRLELANALAAKTVQLIDSQKKFEIMAETCPSGMFIFNLDKQVFEYVNEAYYEMTGIDKVDGITMWRKYIHPDYLELAIEVWEVVSEEEPIHDFEARWIKPWRDDKERWTTSSSSVQTDGAGNSYIFGSFQDISALKYSLQMEKDRADGAVKMKQQQLEFIDMIAHELRNPLGAIMQSSDFLVEKLQAPKRANTGRSPLVTEEDVEDLRTIVLCAQHMSRIINDTLNLSKLEGGLLVATHVPTQPLAVAKGILAMFDAEARRQDVELNLETDASWDEMGVDWIQTDPSRLTQIFINLLANSIKFVSKMKIRKVGITLGASRRSLEPRVTLNRRLSTVSLENWSYNMSSPSFETEPFYLICKISDTGPGMTEEQVASLFQRYFQASPQTHVEYGGSGLGLFISKQLVTLLNGDISVESIKDRGTTFSFSIKTTESQQAGRKASTSESETNEAISLENAPQTILIAEDNLINQNILVKQLHLAGFSTMVANNGREAIDALLADQQDSSQIAICLCDAEMPVLGGIDAVREVRRLEADGMLHNRCPFIAVTANARQEQVSEMLHAGMDDCVTKPFRMPDLLAKMNEVMDRLGLPAIVPKQFKSQKLKDTKLRPSALTRANTEIRSNGSISATIHEESELISHVSPARLWQKETSTTTRPKYDLVLLNTRPRNPVSQILWTYCRGRRVCADGATDRLHAEMFRCSLNDLEEHLRPDVIIGDLDSIKPETLKFYAEETTVGVIEDGDQNSTDLTKAIRYLMSSDKYCRIVLLGGLHGRLDQSMSTINTLLMFPDVYLIDYPNIVIMLRPGEHKIDTSGLGPHCGLVPIRGPVVCTTTGLKWCMDKQTMEFTGLISTNNLVTAPDCIITVKCDAFVLFSIEFEQPETTVEKLI